MHSKSCNRPMLPLPFVMNPLNINILETGTPLLKTYPYYHLRYTLELTFVYFATLCSLCLMRGVDVRCLRCMLLRIKTKSVGLPPFLLLVTDKCLSLPPALAPKIAVGLPLIVVRTNNNNTWAGTVFWGFLVLKVFKGIFWIPLMWNLK